MGIENVDIARKIVLDLLQGDINNVQLYVEEYPGLEPGEDADYVHQLVVSQLQYLAGLTK